MDMERILDIGKAIFCFHPDEEFTSVEHLLETASKNIKLNSHYEVAAASYALALAREIDIEDKRCKAMCKAARDNAHLLRLTLNTTFPLK